MTGSILKGIFLAVCEHAAWTFVSQKKVHAQTPQISGSFHSGHQQVLHSLDAYASLLQTLDGNNLQQVRRQSSTKSHGIGTITSTCCIPSSNKLHVDSILDRNKEAMQQKRGSTDRYVCSLQAVVACC